MFQWAPLQGLFPWWLPPWGPIHQWSPLWGCFPCGWLSGYCTLQDGILSKGHIFFHHPLHFPNTPHQKAWLAGHWQAGLFGPKLEGLSIGQSLLWLVFPNILAREPWVQKWEEVRLADACRSRQDWVVTISILSFGPHLGNFKGSPYFPGKLPEVIYAWDSYKFLPPVGCVDAKAPQFFHFS